MQQDDRGREAQHLAEQVVGVPLFLGELGFYTAPRVELGAPVVVQSPSGLWLSRTAKILPSYITRNLPQRFPPIERVAAEEDLRLAALLADQAAEAVAVAQECADRKRLPMTFQRGCYTLDRSRLKLEFRAPTRVDFRALVRELVKGFRCRLELLQQTSRDDARALGGVGRCGLSICCSTCLKCFPKNADRGEAKESLGLCGKSLCCLTYETPFPKCEGRKPKEGEEVLLSGERASVLKVNDAKRECLVRFASGKIAWMRFPRYSEALARPAEKKGESDASP